MTEQAKPARAAIYARRSAKDEEQRDGGHSASVSQQIRECRAWADAHGWQVAEVFRDDGISASNRAARRPRFAAMLAEVESAGLDGIIAWDIDRLTRRPAVMAELDEARFLHGTLLALVARDRVLRADDEGDEVTALLDSWRGKQESRSISKRVRRGMREGAEEGRPHGQVAYGYRRVYDHDERGIARPRSARDESEPAEAAVVREIADRLIAGQSLRRITADLNARHVPSPRDREWRPVMVRHLVTRQRNVGRRVYQGQVVGVAAWPAILDEGVHSQVVALLADPSRKTTTGGARRHLLSGLLVCGVCDEPVRAALNRTVEAYRCPKGHVTRRRAWVDDFIRHLVVARLSKPDAAALFTRSTDGGKVREALAEVAALRSRLDQAADAYSAGDLDLVQMTRISAKLRPKIEAAEAATRTASDEPILALAIGADADERWEALALEQRRTVIRVLLTARLMPTSQGARTFDPDTVQVTWCRTNAAPEL